MRADRVEIIRVTHLMKPHKIQNTPNYFHNKQHPREMAGKEIEEFLTPQSGKRKGVCERSQRLMRQHKRGNMSPD